MKSFSLISIFAVAGVLQAAPVDVCRVRQIAQEVYSEMQGNSTTKGIEMQLVAQDQLHATPAYYVCEPQQGEGFIIISGHDLGPQLLGYSTTGHFADALSLPVFGEMLQDYAERADAGLIEPIVEPKQADRVMAPAAVINPIVKTYWAQASPYYNLCPEQDGQHSLTGCTATAMAQVMYYHKHPAAPVGTGKALLGWEPLPELDFTAYTFDWDQMLLTYRDVEYTEEQANAVATLMLLCGYGVNMQYSPSGSGANLPPARNALITNFGYSTTTRIYLRKSYTRDNWLQMIKEEILAGRPIILSGRTSNNSGHTFVCDGMGLRNTIHINWGWGEGCNLNVDCDMLTPQGYSEGYNNEVQMILGIQPALEGEDRTLPYNLDICDSIQFKTSNNMLIYPAIHNLGPNDLQLDLGFEVKRGDESLDPLIIKEWVKIKTEANSNPLYTILKFPESWTDGTYTLRMVVQNRNSGEWIPVNGGDVPTAIQFSVVDGVVTYEGYSALQSIAIDAPSAEISLPQDLLGRRVTQMQTGRIYLHNGKKYIAR